MPLSFSGQCVSLSIFLLVSIPTIGEWLRAISHFKSITFFAQGTQWIDTRLTHVQDGHFLVALSCTLSTFTRGYDLKPREMYEPWNKQRFEIWIWFTFLDKPEGARLTTNASQNTVTEGDSVTFKCLVMAAVPQVSIYKFYFNGRLLSSNSNSEYTLNNVSRSQHYGEYKCVPHNDAGDGAEATIRLNINGG